MRILNVWIGRISSPDLNPIEHVWDFLGRRLAARTFPPVMIRELRLALQDEWAAMPQQLIDTLILSMGRRCETCLAVREIISPIKDRMFLAGHPSQGCFGLQSHCAPCYFFNKASFYPSDFSFSKCCLHYTCPYVFGDLTVLNVLIWKAFVQSYIEKTISSLIFPHQCMSRASISSESLFLSSQLLVISGGSVSICAIRTEIECKSELRRTRLLWSKS
ncbi:transposable element Tcb2 transposase [Trichonephila clavipes]|nr:transposable element Tcb2 transposase [Trichonephila clavipes]